MSEDMEVTLYGKRQREHLKQRTAVLNAIGKIFSEMYYIDLTDNTIQDINAGEMKRTEYVDTMDARTTLKKLADSQAVTTFRPIMHDYLDYDTMDMRLGNKPIISQEYLNEDKEWIRCSIMPAERDEGGRNISVVYVARLITAEKEQELAQQRRLEETRTELNQTNTALQEEMAISSALSREYHSLFKIDPVTGKMSLYRTDGMGMDKQVLEKLMQPGVYEGGIVEQYIASFVAPEDQERVCNATRLSVLQEKVPDQGLYKVEFRRIMNGISCYYEMNTIKITDENGKVTFIMGMRDVDNRVRKERMQEMELQKAYVAAEAANKAKTDFLFNMSHDIRTPMNAIIGFTNLLEKHLDDREVVQDYIKKIKTSNDVLLSLINNVLEMARIESGREYLDETRENAFDFLQSVFLLFDSQMKEKGIRFIRSVCVEHPDVIIDKTKIREILLNILSNALKYTPSGGKVTMTLTELPSEQTGYAVYQTVIEDTGIGMSKEFLPHIFEDFSREHSSTESRITGTGLGTAIVKRLVDLMQGKIEVESELGKGTRFTLTMHHRIAGEKDISQTGEITEDYRAGNFAGKRILLAEDNDLNAEIAIAILEDAGFVTERAEDGIICVDMIEKATPDYYDLILMDIQMPNMDGYKATRVIRRLPDKKKASIPIVAMTANAFEEDRQNALKVGMNGHIAKPIHMEKLFSMLAKLL